MAAIAVAVLDALGIFPCAHLRRVEWRHDCAAHRRPSTPQRVSSLTLTDHLGRPAPAPGEPGGAGA